MTAIDFSALIEEGADAWNQWRTDHPTVQPNLSRAYLYGYDLSGFDLSNANLERACLIGANLQDANLSGACLQSAYASDSILSEATLTGAILTQGNFRGADFSGADLSAASVEGTEFGGANLTGSCLAALRANHATSFSEAQGEYVYLNLPPAERYPLVGTCQPGELAQFLQQRFSGGIERVVSSKPVPRRYRWRQLRIATMQLWALSKIQWRKLRKQLGPIAQQAYQYLQTDILPACNLLNANSLSRRMLRLLWRSCRYGQIRTLRQLRKLLAQVKIHTRAGLTTLRLGWADFVQGNRRSQRQLTAGHQHLQAAFDRANQWLQNQAFSQSAYLYTAGLIAETRLRCFGVLTAKYYSKQWGSLKTWLSQLSSHWTEFIQGNGRFQQQLTVGQQRLRLAFLQSSYWLQTEAFRLSAHLYEAGLIVEAYLHRAVQISLRYLKRSKYVQLVLADLKKEYRRSSVPIMLGGGVAILAVVLYPFTRSTVRSQLSSAPVSSSAVSSEIAIESSAASLSTDLGAPETSAAIAATPLSATSTPTTTPSVDMASLSLPCPVTSPTNIETSAGYRYQDGSVYYGEVVNGQPADGEGTMTYPTGNRYTGNYLQGRREGCGTFYFSDGRRYVGQFRTDKFDGLGTWILKNDERYIGEFENNQCSGQGSFIFANGSVQSGTWEEGRLIGTAISCEWGSLQVPVSTDN